MIDFNKAKENERKLLIDGYYFCIRYIDERIKKAIVNGEFRVVINTTGLKFNASVRDLGKVNNDTIKAVIHHYKRQAVKAYVHFEEGYKTAVSINFPISKLIIDWREV